MFPQTYAPMSRTREHGEDMIWKESVQVALGRKLWDTASWVGWIRLSGAPGVVLGAKGWALGAWEAFGGSGEIFVLGFCLSAAIGFLKALVCSRSTGKKKLKDSCQPWLHSPASVPWKTPLSLASCLFPTAQLTPPAPVHCESGAIASLASHKEEPSR